MKDIKIFESVVNSNIVDEIKEASWCADLVQYATVKCGIDGMIASAYLFCPQMIQIKDYIFIKQFWNRTVDKSMDCIERLEAQYHHNKKDIEMSVNTWSIGDFFIGDSREIMGNNEVLHQFGNALVYFWGIRVKELFPDRNIVVKLGNDMMGEFGLCITMYQEDIL